MKKLVAVIPVRAGSQRVKDKNIRAFAGKSLLEHKIDVVRQLPVEDIIVNTDSQEAIEIAKRVGVSYHEREPYYASSECSNSEFHEYLARVTDAENLLIAQVTAPLIRKESYMQAIKEFSQSSCDSLMSVRVLKDFIWYNGEPLNYSRDHMPNSQDLPEYVVPTFGLVIVKRDSMLENRSYIGKNPLFYKISQEEAIDIDTKLDFEFAQFMYEKTFTTLENI